MCEMRSSICVVRSSIWELSLFDMRNKARSCHAYSMLTSQRTEFTHLISESMQIIRAEVIDRSRM
jgi:hypothetical protein